jgi:hypothetical protein
VSQAPLGRCGMNTRICIAKYVLNANDLLA